MVEFSVAHKSDVKVADETLVVSGPLLKPGTFTTADRQTITFTADTVRKIYEKIDSNMPFVITHGGDKIVGYATKFSLTPSGEIYYQGYVFDEKDKILKEGFDSVSGEFDVVMDGSVAKDGTLERIAFVKVPAVPGAEVKKAKEVMMEGMAEEEEIDVPKVVEEVLEEVVELEKPTFNEFLKAVRDRLKKKGLNPIQINTVVSVLKTLIKVPYPYPYPKAKAEGERPTMQEWLKALKDKLSAKGLDRQTIQKVVAVMSDMMKTPYPYPYPQAKGEGTLEEFSALQDELEQVKEQLEGYRKKELEVLKNEVKELGLDADGMVKDMGVEEAITFLGKVKEGVALSKPESSEKSVRIGGTSVAQEVLDELGLGDEVQIE